MVAHGAALPENVPSTRPALAGSLEQIDKAGSVGETGVAQSSETGMAAIVAHAACADTTGGHALWRRMQLGAIQRHTTRDRPVQHSIQPPIVGAERM